jgi:hypothetical protein
MKPGDVVENILTRKRGVVVSSGWSWVDVRWDNGEIEDSVAGWSIRKI